MKDIQKIQKRYVVSLLPFLKKLDLKEGDHLHIELKDGAIILRPVDWVMRENHTKTE
ncbi:hypothetical protein PghCCS26_46190 [Paenibacillus glycanilyticus]|uniref:SpoVT-AbrB domain-containing protein n=1 Tax=Paenibacillus glycanilyticus TaxID=126569 RepID=A0ABQ6NU28_9BACL|nr:AbrB/MazE/SpoVT family DNA-binding domain-containing protein [Paenibacillus glycanilyticus]GMK47489.1 hypothetical protein PghCCS26_46190 [Paenibacillus glycanilyticus]